MATVNEGSASLVQFDAQFKDDSNGEVRSEQPVKSTIGNAVADYFRSPSGKTMICANITGGTFGAATGGGTGAAIAVTSGGAAPAVGGAIAVGLCCWVITCVASLRPLSRYFDSEEAKNSQLEKTRLLKAKS
ncbi:MAG: hypothetical protein ACPGUD_01275 [Parashewanella sp.]